MVLISGDFIIGSNMKKIVAIIVFIILLSIVTTFVQNKIHGKKNEQYIETVFQKDNQLQRKFGHIQKYKIWKVGRYFGAPEGPDYDFYTIHLTGDKYSGVIILDLYKDKNGEIEKYKLSIEE